MLKSILKRAGIGFLIGMIVGNLIALLTGTSSSGEIHLFSARLLEMSGGSAVTASILQSLFSGLYGAICFGTTVFYNLDRLPLALATIMHYLAIALTYIPGALLLGWTDSIRSVLIMAGIQLVAFFFIWLIMYAIFKKEVKKLNEMQKDILQKNEEEQ